MRKASWGALALVLFAVATMRPVAVIPSLHGLLSLAVLAGYLLIGFDPVAMTPRQRQLMIAGFVVGLSSYIVVQVAVRAQGTLTAPWMAVADVAAVAVVALPLWLLWRAMQPVFAAAAAVAAVGPFLPGAYVYGASDWASVAAFAIAGTAAGFTAYRLEHPSGMVGPPTGKRPRIVVAYDIQRLTDEEKAERLAALEKRFRNGEIEEHKYWDKRQEIESR